jgi:Na+-transporting methylmalonyl-CoA/oxaloacetate decarboxylase beta subunit
MMFLDASTVSRRERTLFIVASLDITVLIPSTYVLCGVCAVGTCILSECSQHVLQFFWVHSRCCSK